MLSNHANNNITQKEMTKSKSEKVCTDDIVNSFMSLEGEDWSVAMGRWLEANNPFKKASDETDKGKTAAVDNTEDNDNTERPATSVSQETTQGTDNQAQTTIEGNVGTPQSEDPSNPLLANLLSDTVKTVEQVSEKNPKLTKLVEDDDEYIDKVVTKKRRRPVVIDLIDDDDEDDGIPDSAEVFAMAIKNHSSDSHNQDGETDDTLNAPNCKRAKFDTQPREASGTVNQNTTEVARNVDVNVTQSSSGLIIDTAEGNEVVHAVEQITDRSNPIPSDIINEVESSTEQSTGQNKDVNRPTDEVNEMMVETEQNTERNKKLQDIVSRLNEALQIGNVSVNVRNEESIGNVLRLLPNENVNPIESLLEKEFTSPSKDPTPGEPSPRKRKRNIISKNRLGRIIDKEGKEKRRLSSGQSDASSDKTSDTVTNVTTPKISNTVTTPVSSETHTNPVSFSSQVSGGTLLNGTSSLNGSTPCQANKAASKSVPCPADQNVNLGNIGNVVPVNMVSVVPETNVTPLIGTLTVPQNLHPVLHGPSTSAVSQVIGVLPTATAVNPVIHEATRPTCTRSLLHVPLAPTGVSTAAIAVSSVIQVATPPTPTTAPTLLRLPPAPTRTVPPNILLKFVLNQSRTTTIGNIGSLQNVQPSENVTISTNSGFINSGEQNATFEILSQRFGSLPQSTEAQPVQLLRTKSRTQKFLLPAQATASCSYNLYLSAPTLKSVQEMIKDPNTTIYNSDGEVPVNKDTVWTKVSEYRAGIPFFPDPTFAAIASNNNTGRVILFTGPFTDKMQAHQWFNKVRNTSKT